LSTTELTSADGPPVQWQKAFGGIYGDYVYSVQQTPDGGYIISGGTFSFGPGGSAVYLIKTDPNGDSQWLKTFGGDNYDWGHTARQTIDGGYIIVGRTESFGAGYYDIYLIKTDPNGDSQWQKTFGGSDWEDGYSVQQTVDGGYIISGQTKSFGAGHYDVYLIKTDPNGDSQWQKTFGGSDYDYGRSVQQTGEGGYIIAGGAQSFGAGSTDVYLIKTDPNGTSQWQKTFGGNKRDYGCLVHQTSDGGYIIAGQTESFGAGNRDVYLIKTDPNGNSQWQKTFGGSSEDLGQWVQQTLDGGYIIAGWTMSFGAGSNDAYLIKTNSNGNLLWEKTFGGNSSEIGRSVQQTMDGGYIIASFTWSFGAEMQDVYLIKLCPEGTLSGDLNCDGTVNYEDVKILVSQWLQPRSILYHADIYGVGDGIVDFFDFSTQTEDFGKSSSPH
jgi:regulation of enolase protein 1 (concanavalin A-like superfamily)